MRIEGLDDIEVVRADGHELVQAKQHHRAGSLSDQSVDLWKTLRVWSCAAKTDPELLDNSLFVLVTTDVATPNTAVANLARQSGSTSVAQISAAALTKIAISAKNKALAAAYKEYLALNTADREALLLRVRILDGAPSNVDIEQLLSNALRASVAGEPELRALVRQLEGWWAGRVARHLRGADDQIFGSELFHEIHDIAATLGPDTLPVDHTLLAFKASEAALADEAVYLRQLQLVNCGPNVLLQAITDYVRSQRQIAEWMRVELLFISELARYKRKLTEEWKLRLDLLLDSLSSMDSEKILADRGRGLYQETIQQTLPIRRDFTEGFVMRGSYHSLSNERNVGWHPHYKERL